VWYSHYKYIFNGFDQDELYDLEQDPHELHNVADLPENEELLKEMSRRMWRRIHKLGDRTMANAHYGMFRFVPVGPNG